MKLVIYILSIYTLGLALFPCTDGDHLHDNIVHNHSAETSHQHDSHNNNCEDDTCSPFCVCSCCQTVMVSFTFKDITLLEFIKPQSNYIAQNKEVAYATEKGSLFRPPIG